jgi:hypothetical protein
MQQEPIQGMGWRFVLFVVLSTGIMGAYMFWSEAHKRRGAAQVGKAAAVKGEDVDKTDGGKKTDGAKKKDAAPSSEKPSMGPGKAALSAKPAEAKAGQAKPAVCVDHARVGGSRGFLPHVGHADRPRRRRATH